jgi:acyl-coenzyme A synthetase/AMP-(fatty) acid ligase
MTFEPPEIFNMAEHFLGQRLLDGQGARRALLTDVGPMTYAEVHRRANRYGNLLAARGVRPEERVLVALPDGAEYVAAFFGILRLGAVVVMVNPSLPPDRIRYLYRYTGTRCVLVDPGVAATFRDAARNARPAPQILEVGVDETVAALESASVELDPWPSHRDDAAVWLFSGGTTGEPKAVVQSHRSFANTTELYGKGVLAMGPDDVTLSVPKLFFGYATGSNLLFPFSVGATAALFPEHSAPPCW